MKMYSPCHLLIHMMLMYFLYGVHLASAFLLIYYQISCKVDGTDFLFTSVPVVEFLCVLVFLACVISFKDMYFVEFTLV